MSAEDRYDSRGRLLDGPDDDPACRHGGDGEVCRECAAEFAADEAAYEAWRARNVSVAEPALEDLRGDTLRRQDVVSDPVERQVQELVGRVPAAIAKAGKSMSIRELCGALDYYTSAPWCLVFAVERLEHNGVLRRVKAAEGRPFRWRLVRED